jgi:transcriptional regulator with XRE-family HTH domain
MDLKSRIGHNIGALRHFQGYSVAAFAERIGMTSDRLEGIEAGKIDLDLDECEMLGHALLVDVALLAHPPFNIVPIEGHVPSPVKSPTTS